MNVERGIDRGTRACDRTRCPKAEAKPYDIVHAGKVCPIEEVESLGDQLKIGFLAQLEPARDAHIEVSMIGTEPGIAARADGAIIRGVAIAVDVRPGQQVEGVAGVISNDGRQLEPREDSAFPRAINNGGDDKFVPLVKVGKSSFSAKIRVVEGAKVAVEVSRGVESLAVSVIPNQREIVAKALFNFENSAFVKSGGFRAVLVGLENRGVHEALENESS